MRVKEMVWKGVCVMGLVGIMKFYMDDNRRSLGTSYHEEVCDEYDPPPILAKPEGINGERLLLESLLTRCKFLNVDGMIATHPADLIVDACCHAIWKESKGELLVAGQPNRLVMSQLVGKWRKPEFALAVLSRYLPSIAKPEDDPKTVAVKAAIRAECERRVATLKENGVQPPVVKKPVTTR